MCSNSEVIHYATRVLCENKGAMELWGLHMKVQERCRISNEQFWYILKECPRFALVTRQPSAGRAEDDDYMVVAKTSLRLCKNYAEQECSHCQDLHLCKFFVYGNCRYGKRRNECRLSHDIHSKHNEKLLRECTLHLLQEDELFLLLLQNDPLLLPKVCSYYNKGAGGYGSCTFEGSCINVHLCQHFVQDDCIFGSKCKRLHFIDKCNRRKLEERGLSGDLIQDLPYIYQNIFRIKSSREDMEMETISEPVNQAYTQEEENNEICVHFIRRTCKFLEQCKLIHFNLPYKWEVNEGNGWRELHGMENIERAYCDPKNSNGPGSRAVDFETMTRQGHPVRRLSTASSVTKPLYGHYNLTTHWLWYYKGDHANWIEYGLQDDKHRVTSVNSSELENAYLLGSTSEVMVNKGNREYYVSFRDMYQRNPKHNTKRKVRRRPQFISVQEVKSKIEAVKTLMYTHTNTVTHG